MPIEITCSCGRALNLREELAGKLIRCPACAGTLEVPLPAVEVVEEIVAGPPPLPIQRGDGVAAGPPPLPQQKVSEIELEPPVLTPKRPKEPKKKKKKKSVYSEYYGNETKDGTIVSLEEGWFGSMNAGILGGLFTLLFGIVLLVIFLSIGIRIRGLIIAIFLIVVGIGAMLKGLLELY